MRKLILTFIFAMFSSVSLYSQSTDTYHRFNQVVSPTDFDNYYFVISYFNNKSSYNLRGFTIMDLVDPITSIEIAPAGYALAALTADKNGENKMYVYGLTEADNQLYKSDRKTKSIAAMCYSKDAKKIYYSDAAGIITTLDVKEYETVSVIESKVANPSMLVSSYDGYYLAVTSEDKTKVNILNLESATIRKEFSFLTDVSGIDFSRDGSQLAISTSDGVINIFDTRTFLPTKVITDAGEARSCRFHADGKYIAAIYSPERIDVINLLNDSERMGFATNGTNVKKFNFFKHEDEKSYLVYNINSAIVVQEVDGIKPYYNQLLSTELNDRMNTWLKMMDGETLEEYNERVTDESRMEQMMLYEQEISTGLAGDLISKSNASAGDYNLESSMLAIGFNTMPTIYLEVPSNEVGDFMDMNNLEFRNAKYAVTEDDQFELIYADVVNTQSGKSYTFDNLDRKSLEYLKSDDYVSLELVKQSNMDVIKLEEIKEKITAQAKKESIISDHTNILVDAEVIPSTDADGNNIVNYNINFSYQVEPQFSAVEDFKPGKYITNESGAASSMLKVVDQALSGDFSQYIQAGKKLKIVVSGSADALPISNTIAYNGIYGNLVNITVSENGRLSSLTVTQADGITQNKQLALLRAWGVQDLLLKKNSKLKDMDITIDYNISVSEGKGGEFRRIKVELIFVDAL